MLLNFFVNAQVQDWCPNPADPTTCCLVDGVPTLKCLEVVFGNILFLASAFIVLVLFIMFLIGSFNYLTALGNPEKVKKAQGTLTFAAIGFLLFVGSYLILNIIDLLFLGGTKTIFKFKIPGP